ncbi:LCP family protein [Nocardioides sp. Kera G14]|uniref:LCP family protein n=1 Tax=Nocardioides sp. Kera G14 TaxID=2884264 RepID=UPI001D12A3B3|nr:LCP family protein [Nocardioides sp. Kera G14]UDY24096.1 LCP family protein [Nocardioides sp. Kera G14]
MTEVEDRADAAPRDPRVAVRPTSRTGRGKRRARTRRRHTVAKVLLSTLVVLALISAMSVAYFYRHLNGNLNRIDVTDDILSARPTKPADVGPKGPINILVMGTDTRDCDGCNIDGLNGEGGSDTTILLHLSADRKSAYGVSIPRDSLVDRPACKDKDDKSVIHPAATQQMWNAAYAIGGEACTIAQFEQNTHIKVDHFVSVNFGSFKNMVDAVGGVEVCVPEDIHSEEYGIFIKKGTRKISGKAALAYVRVRHGIGDGSDIGRVKRQQAFIGAMVSQVLSADTLANPIKVTRFLDAATKSLTLDMDITQLAKLALQFKGVGSSGIRFITIPWEPPSWDPNRVVWKPEAAEVWRKLLHDKQLPADLTTDAISVNHLPGQSASPTPTPSESPSTSPSESPSSSPSESSSATSSPSPSPTLEANGRTAEENKALENAGLCT